MKKQSIAKSELVLTEEGKIYHLKLHPEDIADTIFLVGDPGRVQLMSAMFDSIEVQVSNREFVTHTGQYKGQRVSVVSTGIGTDNIDIVINELDALANIDFDSRKVKNKIRKLRLIRIGTSGALHAEIAPGSVIVSAISAGLDNLLHYYRQDKIVFDYALGDDFHRYMDWNEANSRPYFIHSSPQLLDLFEGEKYFKGITLSAPGFYAPQGRSLRLGISDPDYVEKISKYKYKDFRINNFEMEGSALYGLSRLLGHDALTVCIALANRISGKFITEYQSHVEKLLQDTLDKVTNLVGND